MTAFCVFLFLFFFRNIFPFRCIFTSVRGEPLVAPCHKVKEDGDDEDVAQEEIKPLLLSPLGGGEADVKRNLKILARHSHDQDSRNENAATCSKLWIGFKEVKMSNREKALIKTEKDLFHQAVAHVQASRELNIRTSQI